MTGISSQGWRVVGALGAFALLAGCAHIPGHQGYINEADLTNSIKPGVDNRDSVARTMGRPSFEGQFDSRDWYYVGRETSSYAYKLPTV
ncbi:MAG: outer membrane protein assembly factor BamE, partial [Alphaproteobacteria bacterium]|nr:outer membrane protein assembly factor BamE [Alphaproteobacteria bacterium]